MIQSNRDGDFEQIAKSQAWHRIHQAFFLVTPRL
jgi:hypothetical protein